MQEEITQGAVSLSVAAGKMTAELLQKAVKKVLEEMQKKPFQRSLHQGKQILHQLKQHRASRNRKNNLYAFGTWIFVKWIFKTFCAVRIVTNTSSWRCSMWHRMR